MNTTLESFLSLAESMIKQAKNDLISQDNYLVLRAAMYFFLKPAQSDNDNLRTFAGLCAATGINSDAAAKAIFDELLSHQQERIRSLLQDEGYCTQPKKSIPV
mgnify:CR=1 FL=1